MPTKEKPLRRSEELITAGRYREAVIQLENLLDEDPNNVEALNNLGVALFKMEDGERAFDTYLKAIQVDPARPVLGENMSEVVRKGGVARDKMRRAYERLSTGDVVAFPQREALKGIGQKVPEVASYRAAYARVDITPSGSCVPQGWLGEEEVNRAISPLLLQALLLEDERDNKILLIAADLFGVGDALMKAVRAEARQWGIPPEAVMFNASHTHYAPGTVEQVVPGLGPYYAQYARQIRGVIHQLLPHLHDNMQPSFLYAGKTYAQVGMNRRLMEQDGTVRMGPNPEGYYHEDTPILTVDLLENSSTIALINHGCHPTGSGRPTFMSPGYPGYLRKKLIDSGSVDGVMFLQGAAGSAKLARHGEDGVHFTNSPSEAEACAGLLADAVGKAINNELAPVAGPIFARLEQLHLPFKEKPTEEQLKALPEAEQGMQRLLETRWAQHFLNGADYEERALDLEIQLIGLGEETCFITFPGEPVAELARSVLSHVEKKAENTLVLGYTNGLKAYLPTRKVVEEGGYESEEAKMVYLLPSTFEAAVEDEVIDGVQRLVDSWRATDRPNGYGRYHLAEEQGTAFFCLSTGRCGTKTLARLLNTASNARVYHHPRPYLVKETLAAYRGEIDRNRVFWRARGGVIRDAWKDGLIFGETDHNMTAFAAAIDEEIEEAKFIVLVRNPWDFVRSGMRRQYYRGHPWDEGRLRPDRQHPDFATWEGMTSFEKVCWLWNETYLRIHDFLKGLSPDRYLIVQFEELIEDERATKDAFEFLGLEGFDFEAVNGILGRKLNKQKQGAYERPEKWSAEKHEALWATCQNAVEALGLTRYQDMYTSYLEGERLEKGLEQEGEVEGASKSRCTPNTPGLRPDTEEEPRISTTTIWDYKKFKYQEYPEEISPSDIIAPHARRALIDRNTPIASMGSCFARNVAKYLLQRGYNYLVTEQPFQQASAHWDQVFNTACMRQIFEYSLTDEWDPIVRWWPKEEKVQDPFRRDILYPAPTCEEHFERHREASRKALQEAKVVILTLGLIETWRDQRDHATYYRVPSPSIYDPDIHEFYVQTVEDCTRDLDAIQKLLAASNPDAEIVVTVSPVPLFATFRMDVDVVSANRLSKSTLRVAAEYFSQKHDNVHYFPAYEIVTQGVEDPYEDDNRHVTDATIATVMQSFEALFAE